MQTGLQELVLQGRSTELGWINMRLKRDSISLGDIEEMTVGTSGVLDIPPFSPTGIAGSTIEVYFEVGIGFAAFKTVSPILLSGVMTHKPSISGEIFTSTDRVRLYSMGGVPSEFSIGVPWLVSRRFGPWRIASRSHWEELTLWGLGIGFALNLLAAATWRTAPRRNRKRYLAWALVYLVVFGLQLLIWQER